MFEGILRNKKSQVSIQATDELRQKRELEAYRDRTDGRNLSVNHTSSEFQDRCRNQAVHDVVEEDLVVLD